MLKLWNVLTLLMGTSADQRKEQSCSVASITDHGMQQNAALPRMKSGSAVKQGTDL